jgi:hypothetical protein
MADDGHTIWLGPVAVGTDRPDRIDLAATASRIPTDRGGYGQRWCHITDTERDALVAAAQWALDAPHHDGCLANGRDSVCYLIPCTCNRDAALAPFVDKP